MKAQAVPLSIPQINTSPSAGWDIGSKYAFSRLLGFGSYGSVCEAVCLATKARVAVKKYPNIFQDSGGCKRILREIELLYYIDSPYVVKPYDVFMKQGSDLYIVMEMGQIDLYNLRRSIFLIEKQVKVIMYRILLGLNYLHSGGVVHRDIKPANILINSDCTIKICDFSLSRSIAGLFSSSLDCELVFNKDPALRLSDHSEESESRQEENMGGEGDEMEEGDKKEPKTFHCKFEVKFDKPVNMKAYQKSSTVIPSKKIEERSSLPMDINTALEAKKKEQRKVLLCKSKEYNTTHERELSGHIATRCYRPPEIILLERVYTSAVDMWAAGCVFAELLEMVKENQPDISKRCVLFPGNSCFPLSPSDNPTETVLGMPVSPRDQLTVILETCGAPTASDLSFLNDQRAEDYVKAAYKSDTKVDFKSKFPSAKSEAIDLLNKLLEFNPYYRITAKEALRHPYFNDIRDKTLESEMRQPVTLVTDTSSSMSMQMLANQVLQRVMSRKC